MVILAINWTALSAVGTAVAAGVGAWSLVQFRREYHNKLKSGRPIVRVNSAGIREQNGERYILIQFENYGSRPAFDLHEEVKVVVEDLEKVVHSQGISPPNPLSPDTPQSWNAGVKFGEHGAPGLYTFFGIRYRDQLLNQSHSQYWLMEWGGIAGEPGPLDFAHPDDRETAEQLESYFGPQIEALKAEDESRIAPFGWSLGVGVLASLSAAVREEEA